MRFRLGEPPATEAFEPGRDGRWLGDTAGVGDDEPPPWPPEG